MSSEDRKKVLIVEDDTDVREAMAIRLGREFDVVVATDGITAVRQARFERPDVVVLDLGLPAGDGLKVLEWLRDEPQLSRIPAIVLTGRDGRQIEDRAAELGAAAFFHKPADHLELLEEIRRWANQPQALRRRVLVVEDDADVRQSLAIKLRARDFDVVTANDGASALMVANRSAPDVVVLDLGLPCGDGFAVIERMRRLEHLAKTPVVVLSGRDPRASFERALQAGATLCLQKPANELQLLEAIEAAL